MKRLRTKSALHLRRESMPAVHPEFKIIPSLFFVISRNAFGVQNGVHIRTISKNVAQWKIQPMELGISSMVLACSRKEQNG
jgi:hypothetical protein